MMMINDYQLNKQAPESQSLFYGDDEDGDEDDEDDDDDDDDGDDDDKRLPVEQTSSPCSCLTTQNLTFWCQN